MLQPATHAGKPAARRRTFRRLARVLILLTLALALPAGAVTFPDAAKRGATVTISGSGFSAATKYGSVNVVVTTTVGKTNGRSFEVQR